MLLSTRIHRPSRARHMTPSPTIIHVPHASTLVPPDVRESVLLTDEELALETLRITDLYTDELFSMPEGVATTVTFSVNRMIVDPERFLDDDLEPMAERGMGVIYTRTTSGSPLRQPPSSDQRSSLLARYYHPHHARLTHAVDSALEAFGRCLLVDAHSFPDQPLPCHNGLYASGVSPDFCLGTDAFHTPPEATEGLASALQSAGYTVQIDKPFSGTLVPMKHYRKDQRVASIMVEVNRRLYMDEKTGRRSEDFETTRRSLQAALKVLL